MGILDDVCGRNGIYHFINLDTMVEGVELGSLPHQHAILHRTIALQEAVKLLHHGSPLPDSLHGSTSIVGVIVAVDDELDVHLDGSLLAFSLQVAP